MEYPHGHHNHHGRDRRDEDEDYPPQPGRGQQPQFHGGYEVPPPFYGGNNPPPPFYGGNEPPPPQVHHTSHAGLPPHSYPNPAPPNFSNYSEPPPPAADHSHHRPHVPHFPSTGHQNHDKKDEVVNKPSVRIYSKAETNFSLSIRDGKVILARSDPSDPFQIQKFSTIVKDEEGFPSFALVNKATGQAMKHSIGATHPISLYHLLKFCKLNGATIRRECSLTLGFDLFDKVQLIPYNPNILDEYVLWTESRDLGDGYRTIRMVNNIRLNLDAFNGDKNHGGVHDGTTIVLWE